MTDATIRVVAADLAILINQLTHSDGQLEEAMEADRKWKEINDELKLRFATFRMNITIALGFEWGDKPRSDADLVELVRDAVLVRNRKAPEWAAAEGPFVDGWVCPACGARNTPQNLVCGSCVSRVPQAFAAEAGPWRTPPVNLVLADEPKRPAVQQGPPEGDHTYDAITYANMVTREQSKAEVEQVTEALRASVQRWRIGERIQCTDGDGTVITATVTDCQVTRNPDGHIRPPTWIASVAGVTGPNANWYHDDRTVIITDDADQSQPAGAWISSPADWKPLGDEPGPVTQAMPAVTEPRVFLPGAPDPGDITEVQERGNLAIRWRLTDGAWYPNVAGEYSTDWDSMLTGAESGSGVVEVVHDDVELVDEPGQENHRG